MTSGQDLAIEQLHEIQRAGDDLEVVSVEEVEVWVVVQISVYCAGFEHLEGGLPLRDRERLLVYVPRDFPFEIPVVLTDHTRLAGFPHVLWKRELCLYQSPLSEWEPDDGMFGLIERLNEWLDHASKGQLDPIGAPIHPPLTYLSTGPVRIVIPRVNTPFVGDSHWIGAAHLKIVSGNRVDIHDWSPLGENVPMPLAPAILLSQPMPFEFPEKMGDLIAEIEARHIPVDLLLLVLQHAILRNPPETPLYAILGTPMRGIVGSGDLRQHLTAWHIDPMIAKGLRLALEKHSEYEELRKLGEKTEKLLLDWAKDAPVEWCYVLEDRPEIVTRRDEDSAASWFAGKMVSVWGCGALGTHIAEFLARAGAKKLILRDYGFVGPGLTVRQLFDDNDISRAKVRAVQEQLLRIRPDLEVETSLANILKEPLDSGDWTDGADVLIDTTASRTVMRKLELVRRSSQRKITVVSMVIGHRAENGLVVLADRNHSGGIADVTRHAKLEVCNDETYRCFADEFWPESRRSRPFQPEPGCSDITFTGSTADVAALAGSMFNQAAADLSDGLSASAHLSWQPSCSVGKTLAADFSWQPDQICHDPQSDYQIRVSDSAWKEIQGWINRARRTLGAKVETGGVLFGERDDASRVIWVTEVIGPPSDSEHSEDFFLCGVEGVREINEEKINRTRGAVSYIGLWHTHPDPSPSPLPSATDLEGMGKIVGTTKESPLKALLLIVGTLTEVPTIGTYLFSRSDFANGDSYRRRCSIRRVSRTNSPKKIGLSLSGGGSRAIAFHLGCLRALHDRDILDQVQVISAVSGGAVIAAMYAYSDDDFALFDSRVVKVLRQGLLGGIARRAFLTPSLFESAVTLGVSGVAAIAADAGRTLLSGACRLLGRRRPEWMYRTQPPLRRWSSRTSSLVATLRDEIFQGTMLSELGREGMEIVLNACELRTGSAFRFGSRESGCWRFGRVRDNDVTVAEAVAASAAYPLFLPAIDRVFKFSGRDGTEFDERVLLTDGGVFDNLGVTCLEPGRSVDHSYNVFDCDYIICCDAGAGLLSEHVYPYWWVTRMTRSFESIFRKVQTSSYQRMHHHAANGNLEGFVLSYLGQQDHKLPYVPPDLVRREEIWDYPTNFSGMRDGDVHRIAKRGEQLTRLLIARYCPNL